MKQRGLVILAGAVLLLGAGVLWFVSRQEARTPTVAPRVVPPKPTAQPVAPAVPAPPPATEPVAKAPVPPGATPPSSPPPGPGSGSATPPMTPGKSEITSLTNVPARPPGPSSSSAPPPTLDDASAASIQLDQVSLMLRDYRTIAGGVNPVGSNAEIMKSLMGGNPKGAVLGPPEGQYLNPQGELLDRWGTPIFFHQLSGTSMEIRSAGPDKILWTQDDVVQR